MLKKSLLFAEIFKEAAALPAQIHHAKIILGLNPLQQYSIQELSAKFRELAKSLHPDTNPQNQQELTSLFQKVSEAYHLLLQHPENPKPKIQPEPDEPLDPNVQAILDLPLHKFQTIFNAIINQAKKNKLNNLISPSDHPIPILRNILNSLNKNSNAFIHATKIRQVTDNTPYLALLFHAVNSIPPSLNPQSISHPSYISLPPSFVPYDSPDGIFILFPTPTDFSPSDPLPHKPSFIPNQFLLSYNPPGSILPVIVNKQFAQNINLI
jgi:hypothetical protein